jgi:hypothetical protein
VATADDDFASIENEQGLVQRDACKVVLKNCWAQRILEELLLLFSARERGQRIQVIGLIYPHVESHLAINPRSRNQALVDELGLHNRLLLDEGELALLYLLQDQGLVVVLRILLFVNWPVHLKIYVLVADQIVLEDFFPIFF